MERQVYGYGHVPVCCLDVPHTLLFIQVSWMEEGAAQDRSDPWHIWGLYNGICYLFNRKYILIIPNFDIYPSKGQV